MAAAPRPKILFVEDEISISEPFSHALRREGFDATVAGTAARALELAGRDEFDLVLLDLTLPDGDGRDVCRELRKGSDVPIVMLTARGTETDKIVGLELGADDYVVKPFSAREVVARVRTILRRATPSATAPASGTQPEMRFGDLHVDPAARVVTVAGREVALTAKEFDLLVFLASAPRQVFTRTQLLEKVWDSSPQYQDPATVTVHVGRLRQKIETDPEHPRWLTTVWGVGYRFDPAG